MVTHSGDATSSTTRPIAARTPVLLTGGYRIAHRIPASHQRQVAAMIDRRAAKAQSVSCGVDWISGTLGREEIDNQTWLYDCLHALAGVQQLGNTYKRRSLLGFDGWESGGCFVGSNEKMHYAQFAGKYANDAYHMLEHSKVHIRRSDLQITAQYDVELLK